MFTVNGHRTRFNAILLAMISALIGFFEFSQQAIGQDLPNSEFEEWTGSGKPAPFDWEEPTGWKSTNAMTEFISAGVTRSNDARDGSFSCSLETLNFFGSDVPGAIANGNPKLDFSTYSLDVLSGGTPISNRPDRLTGYYKFSSSSDDDHGYVRVILKRYDVEESKPEIVGMGDLVLDKSSSFAAFDIPIVYQNQDQPDSVVVAFFSSDPTAAKAGGKLLVDDIALVAEGSGIDDVDTRSDGYRIYPNPTSGVVNLEAGNQEGGARTIRFYDVLGREVMSKEFNGVSTAIDLSLPEGVYAYRVVGEREAFAGSIVVAR